MSKKPPPRNGEKRELEEFAERYDTYVTIFKDPVEVVFDLMTNGTDEMRLRAAEILMSFRYPKLKSMENKGMQNGPTTNFNITMLAPKPLPAEPEKPAIEINVIPRKALT